MKLAVSYISLEPSYVQTFSQDGKPIGFSTDSAISLFASTSFLYVFGIMISVVAAGVMYMIAGATRIKASEQAIRKSNEIIKRTTIGLLGVLSLFVIIYTFNKDLLTGDVGLSALKSSSAVGGGTGGGVGTGTTTPNPTVPTDGSEKANRDALAAAGITVNKSPCTAAQMQETAPSCTNLAGMPEGVISMLVQLKNSCPGSSIMVTGGTEPGHKSHGPGRYAVDLGIGGQPLDGCISKYPRGPSLNFCYGTWAGLGFVFCNEANTAAHWHVFK